MPTNALVSAIRAAQQERGLTNTALAKELGVALSSCTTVLQGKGVPNARTAEKYAAFLGIDAAEVKALAGRTGKAAKGVKPAKSGKTRKARKAGRAASAQSDGVTISLAEAFDILSDELSLAVHRADKKQRTIIAAILGG